MRALYTRLPSFLDHLGFGPPAPVEVEFVAWSNGRARIRVPYPEGSVGARLARRAGQAHPLPEERNVPAGTLILLEVPADDWRCSACSRGFANSRYWLTPELLMVSSRWKVVLDDPSVFEVPLCCSWPCVDKVRETWAGRSSSRTAHEQVVKNLLVGGAHVECDGDAVAVIRVRPTREEG